MAIEQCVVKSFKTEILKGLQDFTASTGNSFKLALFDSEVTLNNTTTAYETTDEVGNSGTYTAGGGAATVESTFPKLDNTTAIVDFADVSFTSATISAQAAVIYNNSTVSGLTTNAAVCVLDFGGVKSSTAGTFTISFPAAEDDSAILRIA